MHFKSICDLFEISPNGPWIAGGSVRKHLQQEKQDADYDIFFSSSAQCEYYTNLMDEETIVHSISPWCRTYHLLDGAVVQ